MIGEPVEVPQDALDEFMPYVKLSSIVSTLTAENIQDSFKQISDLNIFNSDIGMNAFVLNIYIRPTKFAVNFMKELFNLCEKNANSTNKLANFKSMFLDHLFRDSSDYLFYRNTKDLRFLRLLTDNGALQYSEYSDYLKRFFNRHKNFPNVVLTIAFYLRKYIAEDREFNEILQKYIAESLNSERAAKKFPALYLRATSSPELENQYLQEGCEQGSIEWILKHDDIDALLAYKNCNLNPTKKILRNYFDFPSSIRQEPSLTQYAVSFGATKCFKYLVVQDTDLKYRDKWDHSIQYFAVSTGNIEMVRMIQQQSFKFDKFLKVAAQFAQKDIFNWIIETEISGEDQLKEEMTNSFCYACSSNNPSTILFCLKNGCQVNSIDQGGYSALQSAIISRVYSTLIFLTKLPSTNINFKDGRGETALHYASKIDDDFFAKYLLSIGADPNIQDNQGATAVQKALDNKQQSVLTILLSHPKTKIGNARQIISRAVFGKNKFALKFILDHPEIFNVNAKLDGFSMSPLIILTRSNEYKLVKLMLKYKHVEVNVRDSIFEMNFLQHAIETKSYDVLRLAVATPGIDYKTTTKFRQTLADLVDGDATCGEILKSAGIEF